MNAGWAEVKRCGRDACRPAHDYFSTFSMPRILSPFFRPLLTSMLSPSEMPVLMFWRRKVWCCGVLSVTM